jgi:hypothetical protein
VPLSLLNLTPVSTVTPAAGAALRITGLDTQVSGTGELVAPGTRFRAGFTRLYFLVTYADMLPGVLWRRELLRNGEPIQSFLAPWGQSREGTFTFFFGIEGGFEPGTYRVQLYIGETTAPVTSADFVVTP